MVNDEMVNDETMFVREHNPLLRTSTTVNDEGVNDVSR